jgi:hypothetical protein
MFTISANDRGRRRPTALGLSGLLALALLNQAAGCRFEDIGLGGAGVPVPAVSNDPRRPPLNVPPSRDPSDAGSPQVDADPPANGDGAVPPPVGDASDATVVPPSSDAADGSTVAPADLRRGILLWLALDDRPGSTTARDDSGYLNRVSLQELDTELAWIPGRLGNGLNLALGAAGPGYLRAESSPSINRIGSELTIALWLARPAGSTGVLISRDASVAGGSLYRLEITETDQVRLVVNDRPGVLLNLRTNARLPADTWTHVAITCDERESRIYLDGRMVTRAVYGVPIATDVTPVFIGGWDSDANMGIGGRIAARLDELLVYDRALPELEISALAAGVRPASAQQDRQEDHDEQQNGDDGEDDLAAPVPCCTLPGDRFHLGPPPRRPF